VSGIDIYLSLFLGIGGMGCIISYAYYLKEKRDELKKIESGRCPRCGGKEIVMNDHRSAGCGNRIVGFRCRECGYENSFSMGNGCGI
jgi:predicted RNA-binding Zn-ribbon protein involved in translation (DUF1610 family)